MIHTYSNFVKVVLAVVVVSMLTVGCSKVSDETGTEEQMLVDEPMSATMVKVVASTDYMHIVPEDYPKPSDDKIMEMLSDLQYNVTQNDGTEPSFLNEYYDNKAAGIYVDIVTGEPLFSSADKYDSGTGWPSFTKPINDEVIVTKEDIGIFGARTEVRSRVGDSHLGHVFTDGPADKGGLRYCMNSAALRFIAKEDMEESGYGYLLEIVE